MNVKLYGWSLRYVARVLFSASFHHTDSVFYPVFNLGTYAQECHIFFLLWRNYFGGANK